MRVTIFLLFVSGLMITGCGKQTATNSNQSEESDAVASESPAATAPASASNTSPAVNDTPVKNDDEHHDEGAHHGPGRGFGRGRGGGFRPDMTTIHAMFAAKEKITRTVKPLPTGAVAITESDDEEIASLIQEHVPAMESRVLEDSPLPPMTFHPIFQALIKNSDKYTLEYEDTDKGIKVTYKATDPFVIMLVQEHSKLVSRFLKNGMSEIHKPYELPKVPEADSQREENDADTKAGAAIENLRNGNARFASGRSLHPHDARGWREQLDSGQHPFAVIVGCSDSRVPPELIFDQGFGDLFVVRVAGNIVDNDVVGSVEYAIDHLDTKLVVVLGHSGCGAVTAAIDHSQGKLDREPPEILSLVKHIEPALHCDGRDCSHEQLIEESVRQNVRQSVRQLSAFADVGEAIHDRNVQVVGAVYDMKTGEVAFLNPLAESNK